MENRIRLLKRGIEIYNYDNRGVKSVTIAAPVIINGVRGNLAVSVRKCGKSKYYSHRILLPDGSEFNLSDNKKQNLQRLV